MTTATASAARAQKTGRSTQRRNRPGRWRDFSFFFIPLPGLTGRSQQEPGQAASPAARLERRSAARCSRQPAGRKESYPPHLSLPRKLS